MLTRHLGKEVLAPKDCKTHGRWSQLSHPKETGGSAASYAMSPAFPHCYKARPGCPERISPNSTEGARQPNAIPSRDGPVTSGKREAPREKGCCSCETKRISSPAVRQQVKRLPQKPSPCCSSRQPPPLTRR